MRITGLHQYMVEKNMKRRGVESYVSTLKWLCENAGVEPTPTSQPKYDFKLKEGEYYALRAEDDPNYYKVFVLKRGSDSVLRIQYQSNFTYGSVPPQFQVVSGRQLLKHVRSENMRNTSSLNAFPRITSFNQGLNNHHISGQMGDD